MLLKTSLDANLKAIEIIAVFLERKDFRIDDCEITLGGRTTPLDAIVLCQHISMATNEIVGLKVHDTTFSIYHDTLMRTYHHV